MAVEEDVVVVEQEKVMSVIAEEIAHMAVVFEETPTVVTAQGGQGPEGPQGPAGAGISLISKQNNEVIAMPKCTPVYANGPSGCMIAKGDDVNKKDVLGFVVDDDGIEPASVGNIQSDYLLVATTAEWDAVTGMVGGLSPGSTYFLSPLLGKITPFFGDVSGFSCIVGKAVSSTAFLIRIEPPIML